MTGLTPLQQKNTTASNWSTAVPFFLISFTPAHVSASVCVPLNVLIPALRDVAVKGRLRDYYRYGRVRSCLPYWNDFFLCMRLKMETDETRAQVRRTRHSPRVNHRENHRPNGRASETAPLVNASTCRTQVAIPRQSESFGNEQILGNKHCALCDKRAESAREHSQLLNTVASLRIPCANVNSRS